MSFLENSVFSELDDDFHHLTDDIWETETCWFSFNVPERKMGCWLYAWVRPNMKTAGGGVFLWDDYGAEIQHSPYYKYQYCQPLAPGTRNLRHFSFPEGYTVEMLEPLKRYRLAYQDRKHISLDLEFDGLCAPHPFSTGEPPFDRTSHFDQPGHITGEMTLRGERFAVDSYSVRDRSWGGARPDHLGGRIGYPFGAAKDVAFCLFTRPQEAVDGAEPVNHGFLWRDGQRAQLVSGQRWVERDPDRGWAISMRIIAEDDLGRTLNASGEVVSRIVLTGPRGPCINSLLEWRVDGREAWGEDQDVWRFDQWYKHTRGALGS